MTESTKDKIESIKAALEFYSDEKNYDCDGAPFRMVTSHECVHEFIEIDLGVTAKEALTTLQELETDIADEVLKYLVNAQNKPLEGVNLVGTEVGYKRAMAEVEAFIRNS